MYTHIALWKQVVWWFSRGWLVNDTTSRSLNWAPASAGSYRPPWSHWVTCNVQGCQACASGDINVILSEVSRQLRYDDIAMWIVVLQLYDINSWWLLYLAGSPPMMTSCVHEWDFISFWFAFSITNCIESDNNKILRGETGCQRSPFQATYGTRTRYLFDCLLACLIVPIVNVFLFLI